MEIMNAPALRFGSCLLAASLLPCGFTTASAADVVLKKVPALTVKETPSYPENLARHHLGARLEAATHESEKIDLQAAHSALLGGDPAKTLTLPAGKSTLLVALPKIENVSSISFSTTTAAGEVALATANGKLAADSPEWKDVGRKDLAANGLEVPLGPSEAKYVRLEFNLNEPATVTGFGIFADPRVSDFVSPRKTRAAAEGNYGLISYNYSDMHGKARALYVSSGEQLERAHAMIDDQPRTSYDFSNDDAAPTAIVDLGKPVTLRRLSALHSAGEGRMQFYILNNLPGEAPATHTTAAGEPVPGAGDAPPTVALDDAAMTSIQPVGSAETGADGRSTVEFAATTGRYVMVRWIPAAQAGMNFTIAEIAALGAPAGPLLAQNEVSEDATTGEYASTDGKTLIDDKTMIDPKDMPDEYEDTPPGEGPPPTLPDPPPFTFVPILVPTSP